MASTSVSTGVSRPRRALSAVLFLLTVAAAAAESAPLELWFDHPAPKWDNATPVGNGRIGAMVFGGVTDERIQFNEGSLWKGHPHDYAHAGAAEHLPEIRKLLAAGNFMEAEAQAKANFIGTPGRQQSFQPFGDLHLHFDGLTAAPTGYRRTLDLDAAEARVTFESGGVYYTRETFASFPDQCLVVRLSADQPGQISVRVSITSPHPGSRTSALATSGAQGLILSGQVEAAGERFEARLRGETAGGTVTSDERGMTVTGADSVTLYLVAATSYRNFQDISADPAERSTAMLARLDGRSFGQIRKDHRADFQRLFRRMSLTLGPTHSTLPTDRELAGVKTGGLRSDPNLAALYFQFGRYLLISSSRPGGLPANLQGIWNDQLDPPWESKWTTNINLEMNYWPAEVTNLTECTEPLFALMDGLAVSGARTARTQYGAGGWTLHHNTDLWLGTAPVNGIDGVWPTGAAWLCHHLWEHYLFTGDRSFLKRAYPLMKSASQFFVDTLIRDPKTGWLVTSPSFSPEQAPPGGPRKRGGLVEGPTMDEQLIRALFEHTRAVAALLNADSDFSAKLAGMQHDLAPNQVGHWGQLQEWLQDVDKPNSTHRHMSPLWAMFPGDDITPADPRIFAAAKKLLTWRGDGSTGWSYSWRIALWARAGDAEMALRQLDGLYGRKTLPNFLDLCGPFQIDGNFGATAGIAEMLLQSHETTGSNQESILNLLPALPSAWPSGAVTGLCARGGFVVDLTWHAGRLDHAVVHSTLGQPCQVRVGDRTFEMKVPAGGDFVVPLGGPTAT